MHTIRITTSQNIDIDYELAGFGDRFLARIIDYAIFIGLYFFIFVVYFIFYGANSFGVNNQYEIVFIVLIWLLLCVFYDFICEVFFNGQTIGKRGLKIKVISLNGGRPKVGQYLLRWIFRIVDFTITFGGGAVICMALTEKRQRIGDFVAGTGVVKTAPASRFEELVFAPTLTEGYEAKFPAVAQLNDSDIVLIHDVIKNFNYTRNNMLVYKLALRIRQFLNIPLPENVNDYQFLEMVLNDYKYFTSRLG
ncbi:RDD family protein [Mucilaginibacter sp. KACC 22063]|uniref:RDD family protein n=1 Tax=Mucilaginibacter sp. KACC 22063 TaxID=3025666 RepID=UPI002365D905|nr:RDD family protein [Mucilaginibacter sp. KACC 22063]WDF56056.1 RDD family protein [Mucilaginibacter sp. KACC 22063]